MKKFNPEKELNKIRKGNKNKLVIGIITLLLIIAVGSTYALYQVRHTNKLVFNTIGEFKKRDIYLSVLVDGEYQNDFPPKADDMLYGGYECDGDAKINFDIDRWQVALYASHPDKCTIKFGHKYVDQSGANYPELYQGMIPVYFENGKIYVADITSEWYNYDQHEWANAVLIDNTNETIKSKFYDDNGNLLGGQEVQEEDILQMYVWIPRYKYQLFNVDNLGVSEQMINVEFESETENTGDVVCTYNNLKNGTIEEKCVRKGTDTLAQNDDWYTHPAFLFGDTDLKGLWIGKFETTGTLEDVTIKPNLVPITNIAANTMFETSRNIEKRYSDKYGVNQNEIDTHMMKNMEWGAMAYLTQSKYGRFTVQDGGIISPSPIDAEIWINNNSNYITGCGGDSANAPINSDCNPWTSTNGMHTSTTDNQYGIYGVSGGGVDRMMTTMVDEKGDTVLGKYGFDIIPSSKYYDLYSYNTDLYNINIMHLGDATKETLLPDQTRWYGELTCSIGISRPWMHRGGNPGDQMKAGVFYIWSDNGQIQAQRTFRIVLTAQDGNE